MSEPAQTFYTASVHQYVSENVIKIWGDFGAIFWKKTMGYYSLRYFSDFGLFLKMAVTRKIEVGISSNFLHSISTSICITKCNGDFGAIFWKKPWAIALGIFQILAYFLKWL